MKSRYVTAALAFALLYAGSAQAFGPGNPDRGRTIFNQRCVICHGENGRGKDGMAADFVGEWQRLTKPDAELANSIRSGYRNMQGKFYSAGSCPAQVLGDRDMEDVLAYMRTAFGGASGFSR